MAYSYIPFFLRPLCLKQFFQVQFILSRNDLNISVRIISEISFIIPKKGRQYGYEIRRGSEFAEV